VNNDKSSGGIFGAFERSSFDNKSTLQSLHKDLLFLKDAINLVVGESKAGKTYTTIKSLVDCGLKEQIIHLDFDRNSDQKLKELDVRTYHIGNTKTLYKELIKAEQENNFIDSLPNKILVIDSLQDLAFEHGLDTNQGAYTTIQYAKIFRKTGATLIIIHHTTIDFNGKPKVKGNSSVITSQCDTTVLFEKINASKRIMTVLNTRAEDKIPSGSKIEYIFDDQNPDQPMTTKLKRQNDRVPLN
jgi:RecA-family ATPase